MKPFFLSFFPIILFWDIAHGNILSPFSLKICGNASIKKCENYADSNAPTGHTFTHVLHSWHSFSLISIQASTRSMALNLQTATQVPQYPHLYLFTSIIFILTCQSHNLKRKINYINGIYNHIISIVISMHVSMKLELKDIPGQLAEALKPISEFGGNIRSIVHHRGKITPRNNIPVQITIEIEEFMLEKLIHKLQDMGVIVAQVGEERLMESALVLMIGHIVHSDIKDTIETIDNTGFAEVVDLSLSMPGIDKRSSASIVLNATGKSEMRKALKSLKDIASEKKLLMITPID